MNRIKNISLMILMSAYMLAGNLPSFIHGKDLFGTRVFIENKGQFNAVMNESVKFAFESGRENVYFTNTGLVYKLIKKHGLTHEQREKLERGKYIHPKPDEIHYVKMSWLNSNPEMSIVESEKQTHYFTYGGPEWNASTYKKITYKNVYDKIDIEYVFTDQYEHGIKYNVILHPGADVSKIKIAYTGDVDGIKISKGNVIVKTPLEDITEHLPVSFYQENGQKVPSSFKVVDNVISFDFPSGYDNTKTLVIDPWVTILTSLLSSNVAYDVDYDYIGNVFVYGGLNNAKVAKFSSAGVLLWTFSGALPGIPWYADGDIQCAGNFLVNKNTGKTYIGPGFEFNGTRIVRIDQSGNYDNFITTAIPTWRELWDMGFYCATGQAYGMGGGTNSNNMAGLIDQITATVSTANFTGLPNIGQDIISNAIDDNGVVFISYVISYNQNKLLRINPGFNGNIWDVNSTYTTFQEAANKNLYVGAGLPAGSSNGFNCLAVNANFLFYWDGFNIAAYNKTTGAKVGFTTQNGYVARTYGGIAVDDCNNVYLGGNGNILCYNFNGTSFSPLANIPLGNVGNTPHVYDIKFNRGNNTLYVSGNGFVATYAAIHSNNCGIAATYSAVVNCAGMNNGTGVATLSTSIPNPTINYVWTINGNTVAATYSTTSLTNTATNLPNGLYTVIMHVNAPCGPAYVATVNVNCCANAVVTPSVVQTNCTNTVNSVSLVITGGGTVVPTVTWSPAPQSVSPNSLTATGLPVGITTVVMSYSGQCSQTYTFNMTPTPPPVTFTVQNNTGSYSITCTNPTINLQALTNYTFGPLSYSWTSLTFTASTSTVAVTQPGTITVTAYDPATNCFQTQTLSIGINTTVPQNTVNPQTQISTCNSGSPVTFTGTALSPTVNVQHDWYSPQNPLPNGVPIATSNNSITILSGNIAPGIYTLQTTNLVNGCKAFRTVTVTSLDAWPTFSLASPTNFSIGCNPLHQTTISIINPISTQTPPSICSYTFLAPSFTGVVTPSVLLGTNTSTTTTIPGTWTVIVQDNSNFCRTQISVPVIQNTVAPNVSASMYTQTLTCRNPTVLATGTSSTPNTNITWNVPSTPPNLSTPTVVIGVTQNGPPTSTTSLTYANFTVVATNSINACQSTSVVTINQNFKPPVSSPTISIGTPTAIYCTVGNAPVVLTAGSSTTTSGGGPTAFPVIVQWEGPSPQQTITGASSYSCYVPGVYSLTIEDNYNGCRTTGTINVLDRTQPPVLANPANTSTLDCAADKASLQMSVIAPTTGLMYFIYDYPVGASFSPTNAIIKNLNPILSGTSSQSVSVSMSGIYMYVATNTMTGCKAYGTFTVVNGGINADFIAEPEAGYAPLQVNFTNNSSTSLGTSSINSVWSFGNGTSLTTNASTNGQATYAAPGTYTVMLVVSKGTCLDTAYKTIRVDMPSKMEVPNIFTPNGDGSNDVFFLKVANMSEINAIIFDRWGNKVYETNSSTGNIAWDGKALNGKEAAAGVYFYVIKGTGKDGKEYESKGNVTLVR